MRKIYILDTSVFIHDPTAIVEFKNSDVIIPITVLDELDKLKKGTGTVAKNARMFIRALDEYSNKGPIHSGIKLNHNIMLKIDVSAQGSLGSDPKYGDNRILATAKAIKTKNKKAQVILVSRDINLRTRARGNGMLAQDYEKDKVESLELYSGFRTVINEAAGALLRDTGSIQNGQFGIDLLPNECIAFEDKSGAGICIGRCIGDKIKLVQNQTAWGVGSRSKEQAFALNMLLDPNLPLVTLIGKAGSGKTLVSIASALESVLEKKKFDKVIIFRPTEAVSKDLGYLPGSLEEKLAPWMGAVMDSMEKLFSNKAKSNWKISYDMYREKGLIQLEAISYIRGRSIPNTFIIIDEMQNLSSADAKSLLTRAGEGTKIVCIGDIEQIDSPHLDASNNGLTYVVEKFKNSELAGHITFTRGERSALATEAADIL